MCFNFSKIWPPKNYLFIKIKILYFLGQTFLIYFIYLEVVMLFLILGVNIF